MAAAGKRKYEEMAGRAFQVVVAATRGMGIGNKGALPWSLPPDMAHFKQLTSSTEDRQKQNAVVMGRQAPCILARWHWL